LIGVFAADAPAGVDRATISVKHDDEGKRHEISS
jgi:hypothetical protein